MGQVIAIKDATRVSGTDVVLTYIDECYDRLAALPSFTVRPGQKELSYQVCKALVCGEPLAAEAPTGTGKTIAYLIGAIAAAEKLRNLKDIPIVVATATVGLQNQILTGDLPRLAEAGIIPQSSALLAKGRGRYFCVNSAERLLASGEISSQVDFFDEAGNKQNFASAEISEMLEQWHGHAWTGDLDTYTGMPSESWPMVAASSDTCVGHKCEHYNTCPFFNARRAMTTARIIIANHNLVLSDLAMDKADQDPLFPGHKYLLVFDEAHHLPDKALEAGSGVLKIQDAIAELPKVAAFAKAWQRTPEVAKLFTKQKLAAGDFDIGALLNGLQACKDEIAKLEVEPESFQHRFEKGVIPSELRLALEVVQTSATTLSQAMRDATGALKGASLAEKSAALGAVQVEMLYQCAGLNSLISALVQVTGLLLAPERAVRWIFHKEESFALHVSPLEGADVLKNLLWNSERVATVMVSATLQDFEGFERFRARCGAPETMRTHVLPHIFPYQESALHLVEMANSPTQEQRKDFQAELRRYMPEFIDPKEGTLVLFPSKSLMLQVLPVLRARFGALILAQGDRGLKGLIKLHRDRIDAGEGSLLCGLATLAEGLDLPGTYCTHVIICTVPFMVPTTPVEKELQDVLGKDYFKKRSLPDALVKLIQMVGRLMRRETDRGRITVFDKRLATSWWGAKILKAMPQFKRVKVQPGQPLHELQAHYADFIRKPKPVGESRAA